MKAEGKSGKYKGGVGFSEISKAFVTGAAVGFALGVLFAPDKGSKTREKFKGMVKDLGEELGDTLGGSTV